MSISHDQASGTDARRNLANNNFHLLQSLIDTSHCGKTKLIQRSNFSQESNCDLADYAGAIRKNRSDDRPPQKGIKATRKRKRGNNLKQSFVA